MHRENERNIRQKRERERERETKGRERERERIGVKDSAGSRSLQGMVVSVDWGLLFVVSC